MKKYKTKIVVMIMLILIAASFSSIISTALTDKNSDYYEIEFIQNFSEPEIIEDEQFNNIFLKESNSFTTNGGCPKIPIFTKTFEISPRAKIVDIEITNSDKNFLSMKKQISPVPNFSLVGKNLIQNYELNEQVYKSEPYPNKAYDYDIGMGLSNDNERVKFLSLKMYPLKYNPKQDLVEYFDQIQVKITVKEQNLESKFIDKYDLVVISPQEYTENLMPLVTHKNDFGIKTKLVTLDEIYSSYLGRDDQEKIKYFIKFAVEQWGITNVLLVGDVKKLPIRTTYANWWEPDILSDLYYADIYNSKYEFCSWDSNENDIFGETQINFDAFPPETNDLDDVDLYPDVHIGRLACVDSTEVDISVLKIINYETQTYNQIWFNKIILVGGDTFPLSSGSPPFVFEGEITNEKVAQQLPDFDHKKLWSSKRNLNFLTFNRAINKGAGFLSYAGHGFEHGWGTYRPNSLFDAMGPFQPLYFTPFIKFLRNMEKQPIIFFDACLTAKLDFNITDMDEYYPRVVNLLTKLTKLEYDPSNYYPCFAWSMVNKYGQGGIASIGSTRTAYTLVDKYGVYAGAGYLDVHFFKAYEEGITVGEMLTSSQNDYINNVGHDYFTLEEFILLGDPTLRVGGYP